MSNPRLHLPEPSLTTADVLHLPLGRYLVNAGIIDQLDLVHALGLQRHIDAPLGEIMVSEGLASQSDVLQALALQHRAEVVDLARSPPLLSLANSLPASVCLAHRVVPWLKIGDRLMVATNTPGDFANLRLRMGSAGKKMMPVLADPAQIKHQLGRLYGREYAQRASTRVPAAESCRGWAVNTETRRWSAIAILLALGLALILAPMWTLSIAMLWAFVTLMMTTGLKAAACWAHLSGRGTSGLTFDPRNCPPFRLPHVSVLVPLLKEREIAAALIARLSRLTYPKSLLSVVLVLEEQDQITRDTIARTKLPDWITVIEVPAANKLTTKPRALNYALDFCRGSIIGVWDAEDRPQPDQIERVVTRFQSAPANVACLQGILDYYNPQENWLSRCFTIEYATWWRVVLPGIARLGLVVPLGGTTLFFRRSILEKLGGWDAHNVTEDADLGLRLARHGYITELIQTVTYEEANCRTWPWVRQRSRWLKGFLITWCVHMRDPRKLMADLGLVRFLGIQTMFLATFSQFACAPLLWSFWLTLFGVTHPIALTLGTPVMWFMIGCFIFSGLLNLGISAAAVSGREHRALLGWIPTLPFYFPLGVFAAFKGLHEFVLRPFFWDKTEHGVSLATEENGAAQK